MTAQVSKLSRNQRGDTLIEVLLATVIFSIVISASYTLVNRATRINQVSSERSEAVNAMQTQAETLRFYRDLSYAGDASVWAAILTDNVQLSSPPATTNNCTDYLSVGSSPNQSGAFYFDDTSAKQTYSPNPASGNIGRYEVWVEGYRSSDPLNNDYVDFQIHSCWQGPGGTGPQQASLVYRLSI